MNTLLKLLIKSLKPQMKIRKKKKKEIPKMSFIRLI
jgi:hypothetical protein